MQGSKGPPGRAWPEPRHRGERPWERASQHLLVEAPHEHLDSPNLVCLPSPFKYFLKYLFIYLAVPGLTCSNKDLYLPHGT